MGRSVTRRTRTTAFCAAALTAAGAWIAATPSATATTALVTCPLGTETITYTPGLKLPALPPAPPTPPSPSVRAAHWRPACRST